MRDDLAHTVWRDRRMAVLLLSYVIYIYVYIYICISVCVCMYTYIYIYIYTYMYHIRDACMRHRAAARAVSLRRAAISDQKHDTLTHAHTHTHTHTHSLMWGSFGLSWLESDFSNGLQRWTTGAFISYSEPGPEGEVLVEFVRKTTEHDTLLIHTI